MDIDTVAQAIRLADNGVRLAELDPWDGVDSETAGAHYRRMAQAAIDALQLAEEWGVLSAREYEPYQVFDFREPAEKISVWRNEHGIPASVMSRLIGPWTNA